MLDTNSALKIVAHQLDVDFLTEEERALLRQRFCQAFSAEVLKQIADFQNLNSAPDLSCLSIRKLKQLAKEKEIPSYGVLTKPQLVAALAAALAAAELTQGQKT
ncbi:MAG: hypothetical protein KME14_20380 [Tildeniella torsiva UHER 1998/13D]|jgi:hypothetical protein|nr:hypothetical protein [Tildeniella torsiva UHER 1998/13D]